MRNDCEHIRVHLPDYLEQNLDPPVHAEVEQHLATCAKCRRECRELEQVPLLLRAWSPPVPSEPLWQAIRAKTHRVRTLPDWWRYTLVGSAVAGLILVAFWLWNRPAPPPPALTQIDTEPIFRAHLDWAPHNEAVHLNFSLASGGKMNHEAR